MNVTKRSVWLLLGVAQVLLVGLGCGCSHKETITIYAAAGSTYKCFLDEKSIGTASPEGLEVTVDPMVHTLSWNEGETERTVDLLLPVTDSLLDLLQNISGDTAVDLYSIWVAWQGSDYLLLGTESDVAAKGQVHAKQDTIASGQAFSRHLTLSADFVKVVSAIKCTAGQSKTFASAVNVTLHPEATTTTTADLADEDLFPPANPSWCAKNLRMIVHCLPGLR